MWPKSPSRGASRWRDVQADEAMAPGALDVEKGEEAIEEVSVDLRMTTLPTPQDGGWTLEATCKCKTSLADSSNFLCVLFLQV